MHLSDLEARVRGKSLEELEPLIDFLGVQVLRVVEFELLPCDSSFYGLPGNRLEIGGQVAKY